jgi:hypothetical protein
MSGLPGGLVAVLTLAGYVWLVAFLQFVLYELFHLPLAALALSFPILLGWVLVVFVANVVLGTLGAMGSAWEAWAFGFRRAIVHTLPAQAVAVFTLIGAGFAALPNDSLGTYLYAMTPNAVKATCVLMGLTLAGSGSAVLVTCIPPSIWRIPAVILAVVIGVAAALWAWRGANAILLALQSRWGGGGAFWMLFGIYTLLSVMLVLGVRRWHALIRGMTQLT